MMLGLCAVSTLGAKNLVGSATPTDVSAGDRSSNDKDKENRENELHSVVILTRRVKVMLFDLRL